MVDHRGSIKWRVKKLKKIKFLVRKEMDYMNEPNNRMGVYILVSHLIITLAIILLYGISLFQGHESETLKTVMIVAMGYWFGAITKDTLDSAGRIVKKAADEPAPVQQVQVIRKDDSNDNETK